ncbi:hypothetical protein ROZALSC1DRAFT_26224 [Rozella allomycis CSF55]|uniref:Uncharacterized protein n=1 Tax=Rozella allomycis (strain CSF55) TaxID=988480 RepID=A0A4P9Y8Z2_ROZAC|nr:hypothetical protein ROZALSC1DRAFT_26224 [Rozella allomycis CSF55]
MDCTGMKVETARDVAVHLKREFDRAFQGNRKRSTFAIERVKNNVTCWTHAQHIALLKLHYANRLVDQTGFSMAVSEDEEDLRHSGVNFVVLKKKKGKLIFFDKTSKFDSKKFLYLDTFSKEESERIIFYIETKQLFKGEWTFR